MNWLALETSSDRISLALGEDQRILNEVSAIGNPSVLLDPLFLSLQVEPKEIDAVILGQGPGSYNGLRVGYGFVKGWLLPHPLPVIEVPSTFTMAWSVCESARIEMGDVLILHNARRGEIHGAHFEIKDALPQLVSQNVGPFSALESTFPSSITAIASYEYHQDSFASLKKKSWYRIHPSAAPAALCAMKMNLVPVSRLSELSPHYVRNAVS